MFTKYCEVGFCEARNKRKTGLKINGEGDGLGSMAATKLCLHSLE